MKTFRQASWCFLRQARENVTGPITYV